MIITELEDHFKGMDKKKSNLKDLEPKLALALRKT